MIWSVSTLWRCSGATLPLCLRNGFIFTPSYAKVGTPSGQPAGCRRYFATLLFEFPVSYVGEMTGNCGCGRHHRTHQVSAPAASLAAFKIAVAGGSAALARLQDVRVHAQAHGAS